MITKFIFYFPPLLLWMTVNVTDRIGLSADDRQHRLIAGKDSSLHAFAENPMNSLTQFVEIEEQGVGHSFLLFCGGQTSPAKN